MLKQYRDDLQKIVISYLNTLKDTSDINVNEENLNKEYKDFFTKIKQIVSDGISYISSDLETLVKEVEWDRLNISFLGETNAGKSTIIEALTNGTGITIGEGRKDFTKILTEIKYKNINLMDMPGIEGKEFDTSIEEIKKGIKKAHIIFFVIGTNKEPEEGTIGKIKTLLEPNIKVFTIMNLRGKPTSYKYRELIEESDLKLKDIIQRKFSNIFCKFYCGNIMINAYLGFLSSGDNKEERFKSDIESSINIFKDLATVRKFSGIEELELLIKKMEETIETDIIISNTYKFLKNMEIIIAKILSEKRKFDTHIKEASTQIKKYQEEIDSIRQKYENEINNNIDTNVANLEIHLKKYTLNAIDIRMAEDEIKKGLKAILENDSKKMEKDIEGIVELMEQEIEGKIKEFENRFSLQIEFLPLEYRNIRETLKNIQINFEQNMSEFLNDLANGFLSALEIFIAFSVNVFYGIFTTIKNIIISLLREDDSSRIKRKASMEIDKNIRNVRRKINSIRKGELKKIKKSIKEAFRKMDKNLSYLKNISLNIDKQIKEMDITREKICLMLYRELLGRKIEFAFIDFSLSSLIITGLEVKESEIKEIADKFKVKNVNIYPSITEWIEKCGKMVDSETLEAKDEFNKRAFNVLLSKKISSLPFKKIKKGVK